MQGWYQFGYDGFPSGEVRRRFYRQRDDPCDSEEEREVYDGNDRPVYYYPMHESEESTSIEDNEKSEDDENFATTPMSPTPLSVAALEDFAGRYGCTAVELCDFNYEHADKRKSCEGRDTYFLLHGGAMAVGGRWTNVSDVLRVSAPRHCADGGGITVGIAPRDPSLAAAISLNEDGPFATVDMASAAPPRRFGHCAAAVPLDASATLRAPTASGHGVVHATLVIGGATGDGEGVPRVLHDLRLRGGVLCDPWLCVTALARDRGGAHWTAHAPMLGPPPSACAARVFASLTPWPGASATYAYLGGSPNGWDPLPLLGLCLLRVDTSRWRLSAVWAETLGAEPAARFAHAAAAHGGQLLVFGGVGRRRAYLADLFVLDGATRVWREVFVPSAVTVPPRAFAAAVVAPHPTALLFLLGGEAEGRHEASVWRFNLLTGEWAALRFPQLDRHMTSPHTSREESAGDTLCPSRAGRGRALRVAHFLCARERRRDLAPGEADPPRAPLSAFYFAAMHGSLPLLLSLPSGVLALGGSNAPSVTPIAWMPARDFTLREAVSLWLGAHHGLHHNHTNAGYEGDIDDGNGGSRCGSHGKGRQSGGQIRLVERSLAEEQLAVWRRDTRKRLREN